MDSNKASERLVGMASTLCPALKGKMSGKRIRKSAVTNFRTLPPQVTSSISTRDLAQHMSHSDATADRFYNLSDLVRERARTAAFIKTTIMDQGDEEPSVSPEELAFHIKKQLLSRFDGMLFQGQMPREEDIHVFQASCPNTKATPHQFVAYLKTIVNPPNPDPDPNQP